MFNLNQGIAGSIPCVPKKLFLGTDDSYDSKTLWNALKNQGHSPKKQCCVFKNSISLNIDSNWELPPVSILNVISEILERTVYDQVESYFREKNLVYEFQSGFGSGFSTDTRLFFLTDYIRMDMDEGNMVGKFYWI